MSDIRQYQHLLDPLQLAFAHIYDQAQNSTLHISLICYRRSEYSQTT